VNAPRRDRRAFTIIEIMVVVVIVVLLAAVAVVNLLRARATTYEHLAINNIRRIGHACQMYLLSHQAFPADLIPLGPSAADPPYLPADLIGNGTSVTKQGYVFTYAQGAGGSAFTVLADPAQAGVTGSRHFYIDHELVIHVNGSAPAGPADPVLS